MLDIFYTTLMISIVKIQSTQLKVIISLGTYCDLKTLYVPL